MASSSSMLQVGLGAVLFVFSEMVLIMAFDPLLTKIIPVFESYTPEKYWHLLGGDMVIWIIPMIWTLITLAAIIIVVRVLVTPGEKVSYEHDW